MIIFPDRVKLRSPFGESGRFRLPSFGEKLKQEREKRKITLEQISVSTKIGTRMLQALEENKFNQLPGGIFNKGFVRAYSRVVGLDEDQTVADYMQASGDAPPVSTEIAPRTDAARPNTSREQTENVHRLESISDTPSRPLPWGWFAAVLLVIALALSIWSHGRKESEKQAELSPAVGAAAPSTQTSVPAPPTTPAEQTDHGRSPASSAGSKSGAPTTVPQPSPSVRTSAPVAKATADLTPAAPGEFTVLLRAREQSWVSASTDGKTLSSELLEAGNDLVLRGRKKLTVKLGNSGGVEVQFNGKKLDLRGEFGEVKTITFGPDGMLPNDLPPVVTP